MAWVRLGAALLLMAGTGIYLALSPGTATDGPAGRMLDAAIVPSDAVQVSALPGSVFAQPAQQPACNRLTDKTRYWTVSGDPGDVAAFLQAHAPSWLPDDGTGALSTSGGTTISYQVTDAARGTSRVLAELDFTIAALPDGMTGIRADAELVPAGATCTFSGGAGRTGTAPAHATGAAGLRR